MQINRKNCPAPLRWSMRMGGLLVLCLAGPGWAEEGEQIIELEEYAVERRIEETLTAVSTHSPALLLANEELERVTAATLGETLAWEPGVGESSFGPAVSRPVIRGMEGRRVAVLLDGLPTADASAASPDHAVTVEPFFLREVEIVRGPATLFYGSGAIGGAVDARTTRWAERPGKPTVRAEAEGRYDSVSDGETGLLAVEGGNRHVALSVHALRRRTDEIDIPGLARRTDVPTGHSHGNSELTTEPNPSGTLPNSDSDTTYRSFSARTWFGKGHSAGLSLTRYESIYGVPFHSHDNGTGDPVNEVANVFIELDQQRLEGFVDLDAPLPGLQAVRLRAGRADYEHAEIENGTLQMAFFNESRDLRAEAYLQPLWEDRLVGAVGLQVGESDFSAEDRLGIPRLFPATRTGSLGLFTVGSLRLDRLSVNAGARHEWVSHELRDFAGFDQDYEVSSYSLGASVRLLEGLEAGLAYVHGERAPASAELFSNGPHLATGVFERGSFLQFPARALEPEEADGFEAFVRWSGDRGAHDWQMQVTAFYYDYDPFIFQLRTEWSDQSDLPIFDYVQFPAELYGYEAEAQWTWRVENAGAFRLALQLDSVRGTFDFTTPVTGIMLERPLPRIPPVRYGARLSWEKDGWLVGIEVRRTEAQDRPNLNNETFTPGYTLLHADLRYRFQWQERAFTLTLRGQNLTDEVARNHLSYLKDVAPQPGRNVSFSVAVEL